MENFEVKTEKKAAGCRVEFNERDGYHLITTKKRWTSIEKEIRKSTLDNIKMDELVGKENSVSGTKIFSEQLKKMGNPMESSMIYFIF